MAELIEDGDATNVVIDINAPISEIEPIIPIVANRLGYASVGDSMTPVDFVAQVTKQWWFDHYKAYLAEVKEQLAEQAAENKRAEVEAMIANSPLLGA